MFTTSVYNGLVVVGANKKLLPRASDNRCTQ
jgi:hypothetical protein